MDSIIIEQARSGDPSATIGSARIHSSYDPEKEAGKFLNAHLADVSPNASVVIIGASLGYIDRVLKRTRPDCSIISIHLDTDLFESRVGNKKLPESVKRWHPGSGIDIADFFLSTLKETSISRLRILRWPASVKARPEVAALAEEALASVIRRYSGNITTTAAFGRLWIRNTLRNFLELDKVISPLVSPKTVVLAASGPGLEKTLSILKLYRLKYQLWSLPSSLPALNYAGIKPDLVIATDPGYWARLHIRYFPEGIPIAMPLSAASVHNNSGAVLLLTQNVPGESFLLKGGNWPEVHIPAMGTVAATAIELWKRISSGPLIIAGLDLCWHDLQSHARPHAFDGWLTAQSQRQNPINSIAWDRALKLAPKRMGAYRSGYALQTYTDWFRKNIPVGRVFRLNPTDSESSAVPIPRMVDRGPSLFRELPQLNELSDIFPIIKSSEDYNRRQQTVINLISRWQNKLGKPEKEFDLEFLDFLYTLDPGGILEMNNCGKGQYSEIRNRHLERVKRILDRLELTFG